jgi:hypothetical protein
MRLTKIKDMSNIIKQLNNAGFTGGWFTFKKDECSCCFGLEGTFFQVNRNTPRNWGNWGTEFGRFKVTFKTEDEARALEFIAIANGIVEEKFKRHPDVTVIQSTGVSSAIIVEVAPKR